MIENKLLVPINQKEKTMSALSNLKLVAVKKPTHMPAVVIRRNKLGSKLWEQIQLAKSQMDGTPFVVMKYSSIKDPQTGLRKQVEVPKRISHGGFSQNRAKSAYPLNMALGLLNLRKVSLVLKLLAEKSL